MLLRLLQSILAVSLNVESFQVSEDAMKDYEGFEHSIMVDSVYPYAKWTMIGLLCGRMVLMLISIKCLSITKVYFYYELLVVLVEQCLLPQD